MDENEGPVSTQLFEALFSPRHLEAAQEEKLMAHIQLLNSKA